MKKLFTVIVLLSGLFSIGLDKLEEREIISTVTSMITAINEKNADDFIGLLNAILYRLPTEKKKTFEGI
ncbi:hypothetical protein [Bacillus sp. FJAT-44742]|uniref:hypothetical protein n=1 Tax=Bacillus sp. FJAT-44742 TaxID=2014005 RepID=UPI000C24E229|nr:hypothetical protein [Bacillus sp. FJAT-44742]